MTRNNRNISFLTFVNRKYRKLSGQSPKVILFYDIDDYMLYLFYDVYNEDAEKYYYKLEEDLIEYVNLQLGIKKRKTNAK
ncbi:MAG: hypothetical protein HFH45_03540 [Bacilli bacterium]|nr:hypothetical protein [Bacilli bacterium]